MTRNRQDGFSLVELMVAMTITLIVSAAIYGLLTSGSNAFRREPELADRQQNIRVAMDLVARDVFNAGAGLPRYSQVFTISDPLGGDCQAALNGCGVEGALGLTAAQNRAPGDGSDPSDRTDVLEMVAVDEQCPVLSVCNSEPTGTAPGTVGVFATRDRVPRCMRLPGFALLSNEQSFVIQPAAVVASASILCKDASAGQNDNLTLSVLPDQFRVPVTALGVPNPTPQATGSVYLAAGRVVRYRIGPSLDPAESATPALWRSETGRYDATGVVVPEPGDAGFPGAGSPWELVARGIEDLQVEYMAGDLVWRNQPPPASTVGPPPPADSIVRQVRITLSARATAANLAGETNAAGVGPRAVRGQLSTTVTPRAAFNELQMVGQIR